MGQREIGLIVFGENEIVPTLTLQLSLSQSCLQELFTIASQFVIVKKLLNYSSCYMRLKTPRESPFLGFEQNKAVVRQLIKSGLE